MDSNLNRVLNQNRHQLSGQLSKYTNVVKGKVKQLTRWCQGNHHNLLIYVLGWQFRWFTVDSASGTLSYYLCDESTPQIIGNSPRGQVTKRWKHINCSEEFTFVIFKVHLASAVVCPSDEDSRTFSLSCASGDILKLRATDARARQEWVDGLRAIVECHTLVCYEHPIKYSVNWRKTNLGYGIRFIASTWEFSCLRCIRSR